MTDGAAAIVGSDVLVGLAILVGDVNIVCKDNFDPIQTIKLTTITPDTVPQTRTSLYHRRRFSFTRRANCREASLKFSSMITICLSSSWRGLIFGFAGLACFRRKGSRLVQTLPFLQFENPIRVVPKTLLSLSTRSEYITFAPSKPSLTCPQVCPPSVETYPPPSVPA